MGKQARLRKERRVALNKSVKEEIKSRKRVRFDFKKLVSSPTVYIIILALISIIYFPFYKNYQDNKPMYAIIKTSEGDIKVELYKKDAPKTVENFVKLSENGYYKHLTWHRIIKEFVIQTGDPKGDGTGGPGYEFDDEINDHKIVKGTMAMANAGPNTNGSQFFIVTEKDQPDLDGKYTVFGQVLEGMDIVAKIADTPTDKEDLPIIPVYFEEAKIIR